MSHTAQGIFRVLGQLAEGYIAVQYLRHCGELPKQIRPTGGEVISIRDDLWIDSVPVKMVDIDDRVPNTLLKITVEDRTRVIRVERAV